MLRNGNSRIEVIYVFLENIKGEFDFHKEIKINFD